MPVFKYEVIVGLVLLAATFWVGQELQLSSR